MQLLSSAITEVDGKGDGFKRRKEGAKHQAIEIHFHFHFYFITISFK